MQKLKQALLTCYCITLLVLSASSQAPVVPCLISNGLCNYNLSDTSTALPFNSIGKDLAINYGKYDTSITYPGDITYINEDDGKCTNSSTNLY